MQYVGITEQCLHHRINCHRSSVRSGNSTFLYEHFNKEGHCFDDVIIRIIDKVDDSVENKKELLLEKELYWINILNSAFPLGLNDNLKTPVVYLIPHTFLAPTSISETNCHVVNVGMVLKRKML